MGNLITTAKAAKLADIGDSSTIRKAILDGQLKAIKPGHDWLIDEDDFRVWMEDNPIYKRVRKVKKVNSI